MVKVNLKSENGRSMVEMLGVLAIVGVLSVGGVYGYGVAMKKHKANELLHQASMLATTISAQAMSNDGNLPSTITSFGNSNYGTFSPSTTDALDGKGFSIEISSMDSAVCTQMEKMAGGMVQGASCSGTTLTLTYYKNLATNETEGAKSPTGGSSSSTNSCDGKCDENATCESGGYCQCKPGYYGDGQTCTSDNGADSLEDCQALDERYGWNGSQCVDCLATLGALFYGSGGSIETACYCGSSGKKPDGSCCDWEHGWNGSQCVYCGSGSIGSGGSPETACDCGSTGKKPDGSCCTEYHGWNGSQCIDCGGGIADSGGSIETACHCGSSAKKPDGSCCDVGYGWNGSQCVDCGGNFYYGSGGSIETACDCSGKKPDGSCCAEYHGWNGEQCVECNPLGAGSGGSVATACVCDDKNPDGSCQFP